MKQWDFVNVVNVLLQSLLIYAHGPGPGGPLKSSGSSEMRVEFEIKEELPVGTIVGRIPTRPGFTYRFNENVALFLINDTNGEVRTSRVIDRESLQSDTFDLVVLSSQPTYPVEVRIKIIDINDHFPTFPEPRVALTFSESSTPGTRIFLDIAEDLDSEPNGMTTNYAILDGNDDGHFDLSVSTNPSGEAPFLYLETTGKLDRETRSVYYLNISAHDNGIPRKVGYTVLEVKVGDINDNPPIFDHSDYVVSLNESVGFGSHVLQVMATDNDEGDNAKLTYFLAEDEMQFSVDPSTGHISTAQHYLNCQQNCPQKQQSCPKSCVFTVFARDHGVPAQDGRTYVTVNLLSANDRVPIIKFKYFPDTAKAASVDENAQNGSVVAAVSTLDQNEQLNGDMVVEIVSGNDLNHFRLESTPFFQLIRVNAVLDRERIGKYNLSIMATDKGSPRRRTALAFLLIDVNDINDHDPIFEQTEYSAVLRELIPIGSFVASISAHDDDTGINAQLYYSITSGNDLDWFTIESESGLLTTKTELDREQQDVIRLKISARDGGPNPRWAFSEIKITILDENDEPPKFSASVVNVSLPESVPIGSLITTMKALDHDQGTNGSVSYSLASVVEVNYPGYFHLDLNSGNLVTKLPCDRELLQDYQIQVIAKDKGSPPLSSTATVNLRLSDINDNEPVVYPAVYFIRLAKSSPMGTTVIQLTATDADEGSNSELTFAIMDEKNMFAIDHLTGKVTLKQDFSSVRNGYLAFTAYVTDGGGRRSKENIKGHVFGVNYQMAKEEKVVNFGVTEDPGKGTGESRRIGTIFESGALPSLSDLKYVIVDGDPGGVFRIDGDGTLYADKGIDREVTPDLSLKIVSWNEGTDFEVWRVKIHVNDLNDNGPVFRTNLGFAEVEINEDSAIGSEVILVQAFDPDFGQNATITFSLSKNPSEIFRIDPVTGLVTLKKILIDRLGNFSTNCFQNVNQRHTLEVVAQDGGQPPMKAYQEIAVNVKDVNNFTPVFDSPTFEISLLESAPRNSRFFALHARDDDCGANALVTYTITDGTLKQKFGILPDGNIYVKESLDREDEDYYTLTVVAHDNGFPPRSSAAQVIVHVRDENDNFPRFLNSTFIFFIMENEEADTFVGKVAATDLDSGRNAELSYSFSTGQKHFKIESRSGFVRSLRMFDREELIASTGKDYLTLDVFVHDGGHPPKTDSAQIRIYIRDANDNQPEFVKKVYLTQVSERAALGSQVLRVHATDSDEGVNGIVLYYFQREVKHFKIDSATGQISVAKHLDRESVPEYTLEVVAQDMAPRSLNSSVKVTVQVLDENDNAPEFTQSEPFIRILETTTVGTELMQFRASDPDIGLNQQVTLSITGGNKHEIFRIDPKSGSFYLNKPLDFEKQANYVLNITASDSGSPALSTTIQFLVDIGDCNDNPPVFPATAIFRQIPEGIPINSTIVSVSAEDADSGLNGKIKYSIIEQEPSGGNFFGIDPEEGRIVTLMEIDREFSDTFRLTVLATDQAIPISQRLSAEKLVTIIVEDSNDNEPKFTCMNAAILKKEVNHQDSEIFRIEAVDPDAESNGVVTFEIVSGDASLFSLNRKTGNLSLRNTISNLQARYQLTIRATDEAIQSQRKSSDLYLTMIGVEEESGQSLAFTRPSYKGFIYENEPIGTSILHVSSVVPVDLKSSDVEYYITNITGIKNGAKVDRLFEIDVRRGTIYTATVLDRETGPAQMQVEVYAILISSTGLRTASVQVEIEVLDRNDSPPKFKETKKELSISESAPVDYEIMTVVATDDDAIGNISYSIEGDGEVGKFRIGSENGILRLSEPFDREEQDEFLLFIRAFDGIQHSVMRLHIKLRDENDNVPTFSNNGIYSFEIPEDAAVGVSVGRLEATDPDQELNGAVTYSVVSRWGNDVFTLNPETGIFTLINRVDYENIQHYVFVVQAQDSGVPSLSSTATVYINIEDLNDNLPIFEPMSYTREVYENISIGSVIVTVGATDLDSGLNGEVEFSLQSGNENGHFEIFKNGTIFTRQLLDRETISSYNLVVAANNPGFSAQSATAQVSILLKDVNDEVPVFISPNRTSVLEGQHVNTLVLVVNALDRDDGRNGYVEYSLANEKSTFSLGPVDGLLRVHGIIDRETRQNYTLMITAKDKGDPPKSSTQSLFVKIDDFNDNTPSFDSRKYSSVIPENSSLGMSIVEVSATDLDEGLNGQIRFSIVDGDRNRDFVIDEDTGLIRLSRVLNYERTKSYTLTIRAEDFGTEPKYDTATVLISITNFNDNAPVFLDSPYVAHVRENIVDFPIPVVRLTAFDADPNPNQQIRYLIKDGDKGTFRIDSTSGEITAHRKLDREQQSEYLLTVVAIDSGSPRLTGTGTVRVRIADMNDNLPIFERRRYEFSVRGNTHPGTNISRLITSDADEGLNGKVRYFLHGESPFGIDEETGDIVTKAEINAVVSHQIFRLVAEARDSNEIQPLHSTVNVTIRIENSNMDSHIFKGFKGPSEYSVTIPDGSGRDTFIFGLSPDDMLFGLGRRYFLSGADADRFAMNQETGVVTTVRTLRNHGNSPSNFYIEINGNDPLVKDPISSVISIRISLSNSNTFPQIQAKQNSFTFSENTKNQSIIQIQSSPLQSRLNYSIGGGNIGNTFEIDPKTGLVRLSSIGLDYETTKAFDLWILARNDKLTSALRLQIHVTDLNDNEPVFEKSRYELTLPEEEAGPKVIGSILASDADSGPWGEVLYRFSADSQAMYGHLFEIDSKSGQLVSKVKLDREEMSAYEVMVEGVDGGTPPLSGTTSVLITVQDINDNPPRFTRLFSVNVTENASLGTFVVQVKSVDKDIGSNANCTYIFTDQNSDAPFAIDGISGNITVTGLLDRETQDEYLIRVGAIDGSWRAETLVTITLTDLNDNAPEFEQSFYSFNIGEGQEEVSLVGQVIAADRDKAGLNSSVTYAMNTPSDFSIDPLSGEIYTKRKLYYKATRRHDSPENEHQLIVVATDRGNPPLSSETQVKINIVSANNSPPKFEFPVYEISVLENAAPGDRILQMVATDSDDIGFNAVIEYYITSGSGPVTSGGLDVTGASELLNIDKTSGWITLRSSVAGQKSRIYDLGVRAVDKGIPPLWTQVPLRVTITGPNEYGPIFTSLSYRVIVPENEAVGTVIVTLTARDEDSGPNGQVTYTINSGNESGKFAIDSTSGTLSIRDPLDYETQKEHHLTVVAMDKGFQRRQSTVEVAVLLTDTNDNPPVFEKLKYSVDLPENMTPNTSILQLRATDQDSAKFAVIQYAIVGGTGQSYFFLNATTGQLQSKLSFDYEEQTEYGLEILAANPDSNLFGSTHVRVQIVGVNEFFPRFVQPVFQFLVSESAGMGTIVGKVEATDEDSGPDGLIYYLFLGSSLDRGFSIDSSTGTVTVSRRLDRESQARVILTVVAKNAGSIRGHDIDEAQIIITIQDGNDPPVFEKDFYAVQISESTRPFAHVLTVQASDIDIRQVNSRFSYDILEGNDDGAFRIDAGTGRIETLKGLDRETRGSYSLTVGAVDLGDPPQTGRTTVAITLTDENDSTPYLLASSGSILENEPIGTKVMTLEAADLDLPPNTSPFTFRLLGASFPPKVKVDPKTGVVTSLASFNRETTPELKIKVEISDNGIPALKSETDVVITVLDINDSPSMSRTADLFILTLKGQLPTDEVAVLYPVDADSTGNYKCRQEHAPLQSDFSVRSDCKLYVGRLPAQKKQSLTTIAHDGRHKEVTSTTNIQFTAYDKDTLNSAVVIRVNEVTPVQILERFLKLRLLFSRLREEIQILGLIPFQNGTDLILTGSEKESKKTFVASLEAQKHALQETLNGPLVIDYSICSANPCRNGASSCASSIRSLESRAITEIPNIILSVPALEISFVCTCAGDFEGTECEYRKEPCKPNPCSGDETCTKLGHDFECACALNRYGKRCEFEQVNPCDVKPCRNGGTCHPNYATSQSESASYFCLCRPNFLGQNCSVSGVNACAPNPCKNGGECSVEGGVTPNAAKCRCKNMFYGKYCEKSSIGFSEGSFMTFDPLDSNTNDISIVLSTNKENSLLVYNYGEEVGGRSDFIVLELVKGQARLAFGGSRTAMRSVTLRKIVTDGKWYKILAIRNAKVISLSISDCEENGEYCTECPVGDLSCYGNDVGHTGSLTFNGNPVYIGGLQRVTPLLERPGQIQTDDFVGCVQSLEINGKSLNVSGSIASRGISGKCQRVPAICNSDRNRCGSQGKCIDLWDSHVCQCPNVNFIAPNCDEALSAYTIKEGGYFEFNLGQKYRRHQLLATIGQKYGDDKTQSVTSGDYVSVDFRTTSPNGLLFFAATNNDYTLLQLQDGDLSFSTRLDRSYAINTTMEKSIVVTDGNWHTVRIQRQDQILHLYIDGQQWGDELNSASGHNFLDPYLTRLAIGGLPLDHNAGLQLSSFDGCISNFIINENLIPLNGSGGLMATNRTHEIELGCSNALRSSSSPDPLSIGVTLVVIFFTVLLVAILVSFIVFRLRRNEKGSSPSLASPGIGLLGKVSTPQGPSENSHKMKGHHSETHVTGGQVGIRNLKKKGGTDAQTYQTPDIIDRNSHPPHSIPSPVLRGGFNSVSMEPDISDLPEHYDLENASSIAPSDIDIVYHYKGYRENNVKSRAKSPPFGAHSHNFSVSSRSPELMRPSPLSRGLKSTPLARLSPSSELSQQTGPRILTLQDISGKPYQNALLQKKEVMSQSERSQSSGRSCMINRSAHAMQQQHKRKRRKCGGEDRNSNVSIGGLTAEEIERLNNSRQNNSSLISTLDVGSTSESDQNDQKNGEFTKQRAPFGSGRRGAHGSRPRRNNSTTDDDEEQSGNDSFSCSEFEFERKRGNYGPQSGSHAFPSSAMPNYAEPSRTQPKKVGGEAESFRGSLSTLVASDDDLAYIGNYRKSSLDRTGEDHWNYLNGWNRPNYGHGGSSNNVFNNIPEGPEVPPNSNLPLPTTHAPSSGTNNLGLTNRGGDRGDRGGGGGSRCVGGRNPTEEYV